MKQTIYKIDTKGKTRFITISVDGSTIIQESGLLDGKSVTNISQCEGKNIGKVNETTPENQAIIEAVAKIKKKLSEEYFESVETAQTVEYISPMLAKDFKKESKKVIYPCYVQPKMDGMRCLKKGSQLTSRDNKLITTLKHIEKVLPEIADYFDGELYISGKSFQENMTLIKKYRPGETEDVKYHVYDMVLPNLPFSERYALLKTLVKDIDVIELVPTYVATNEADIKAYHGMFIRDGFEGTIVRHSDDGYKVNGRSSSLLKYKDFLDLACEIVDVVPSERRPTHGSFICKLPDGRTFGTGMKFSHAQREEILINKHEYIGKTSEIRFFEYTDEGLPRFPICHGIRLDK